MYSISITILNPTSHIPILMTPMKNGFLTFSGRHPRGWNLTPTGLKSPTNDSKPPDDPSKWESASSKDLIVDYYLMPVVAGSPENSTTAQRRQESQMTSSWIHGMDGSLVSLGKRSHISEPEDEEEEPLSKKSK